MRMILKKFLICVCVSSFFSTATLMGARSQNNPTEASYLQEVYSWFQQRLRAWGWWSQGNIQSNGEEQCSTCGQNEETKKDSGIPSPDGNNGEDLDSKDSETSESDQENSDPSESGDSQLEDAENFEEELLEDSDIVGKLPSTGANPFVHRLSEILLHRAFDPMLSEKQQAERLAQLESVSAFSDVDSEFSNKINEAKMLLNGNPSLESWLFGLGAGELNDLNTAFKELSVIRKKLRVHLKFALSHSEVSELTKLIQHFDTLLAQMKLLEHRNGKELSRVKTLYDRLPRLGRNYLKNRFALEEPGDNDASSNIAEKLESGELEDLWRVAAFAEHSHFKLSPFHPSPGFSESRAWYRHNKGSVGSDLLPLSRLSELPKSLLGQPGLGLEANIEKGTVFALTKRQRTHHEKPGSKAPQKQQVTIVGFDVSGSMRGLRTEFQAALITAFVIDAMSDLKLSGDPFHKLILVPFDSQLYTAHWVKSVSDAVNLLGDYSTILQCRHGGTNIEAFLEYALDLIGSKEKQEGLDFQYANIMLFTDGEDEVDFARMKDLRTQIGRGSYIQTIFVAVGAQNNDLKTFAESSSSTELGQSFYREFSDNEIKFMWDESSLEAHDRTAFFTTSDSRDLSQLGKDTWNEVKTDIFSLQSVLNRPLASSFFQKVLSLKSKSKGKNAKLELWLKEARNMLLQIDKPLDLNADDREFIAGDLLKSFRLRSGTKLTKLSKNELKLIQEITTQLTTRTL